MGKRAITEISLKTWNLQRLLKTLSFPNIGIRNVLTGVAMCPLAPSFLDVTFSTHLLLPMKEEGTCYKQISETTSHCHFWRMQWVLWEFTWIRRG